MEKKWASSELEITIDGKRKQTASASSSTFQWTEVKRERLLGTHDSNTSITYSHQMDLQDSLPEGSNMRMTFTLVGGTAWQINGIAICNAKTPMPVVQLSST